METNRQRILSLFSMVLCLTFLSFGCSDNNSDLGVSPTLHNTDLPVLASDGLNGPEGIAVDALDNLYIADTGNDRVLRVSADGVITVVAGDGTEGFSGDGGPAVYAQLHSPSDIALDSLGNLYITDFNNRRIRKVTSEGIISTIAGGGDIKSEDIIDGDLATSVELFFPTHIAVDSTGNIYFFETGVFGPPDIIRKVSPDGVISTVAGGGTECVGNEVLGTSIALGSANVAVDSEGYLYIANEGCHTVLESTPDGMIYTLAGNGIEGFSGDGGLATEAELSDPAGIAVDEDGTVYIADYMDNCIRMVTPDGVISTLIAGLNHPGDIALDTNGNLLILERDPNHYLYRVLKFDLMSE